MKAFQISESSSGLEVGVVDSTDPEVVDSEILIDVEFSGINFKDAMVAAPNSRVRRDPVLIGGVDAAGTVRESHDPAVPVGTRVAVHGGVIGVARNGGFAQRLSAPVANVSPLPEQLSTRDAMIIGTAGFTAMQSILALQDHGLSAGAEVLVTGATGGVGSQSVSFLRACGFLPVASTGSPESSEWLFSQGAHRVIGRGEVTDKLDRALGPELWDGAIDCVGGDTLWNVIRSLRYGGAVAASGLVASAELSGNVYPFITRNVALLGIDSVQASSQTRQRVWSALGDIAQQIDFESLIDSVVGLSGIADALEKVRRGATRGRILVTTQE